MFANLGFPDAAERQAKLRLAYALNEVIEARRLSQAYAAKVLGVTQPKVSALRHKLTGPATGVAISVLATSAVRDADYASQQLRADIESAERQCAGERSVSG